MWFWGVLIAIVAVGFVAFTGAPYVPSKRRDLERAFTELYPLGERDVLVDIGSGDGVVLRAASRRGARAVGYEIHPLLVVISRLLSKGDRAVSVRLANFWRAQLPDDTTVVYVFGDARDIRNMYAKVQREASRMGHELCFVTYGFRVPGIDPDGAVGAHYLYRVGPLQGRSEAV